MTYDFREIEAKWQKYWEQQGTFKVENNADKPKFYVLDMFPYPSGARVSFKIVTSIFFANLNFMKITT